MLESKGKKCNRPSDPVTVNETDDPDVKFAKDYYILRGHMMQRYSVEDD